MISAINASSISRNAVLRSPKGTAEGQTVSHAPSASDNGCVPSQGRDTDPLRPEWAI